MTAIVQVRNLSDEAHERLKRGAQARGLTMAGYIERLLDLHWTMLDTLPDNTGDPRDRALVKHILEELQLEPVRV